MKKLHAFLSITGSILAVGLIAARAGATPSSHLWTPSIDIQPYRTMHITTDVYVPVKKPRGARPGTITNLGLTGGVYATEKTGVELGFDHIEGTYPIYLNGKLGFREGTLWSSSPAFAVGLYSFGLKRGGEARTGKTAKTGTDYDVLYIKASKNFGRMGVLSGGAYSGNRKLLVDENGNASEDGVMITWDKTLGHISENLSINLDYMSGNSTYGTFTYGFGWKFAPNVSLSFGFVDQNNDKLTPGNQFVVEVDVDFDAFRKKR
ncbi:hypothetical protein HY522_02200 [bacterium]|nr:hypothetical protein [bacterium]